MRSEVIHDCSTRAQFYDRVRGIDATGIQVEGSIASREEDIAAIIRRRGAAALPNPSAEAIGSNGVNHHARKVVGSAEAEEPSMPWTLVSVRAESSIHYPITQQEARPLILTKRAKRQRASGRSFTGAG